MTIFRSPFGFYDYNITELIEYNLRRRLIFGLIESGAWTKVATGEDTARHKVLKRVSSGKIYEGLGPQWIWEDNADGNILKATQVTVNSVPDASAKIDFSRGQVLFATAPPESAVVECEYSFLDVGVYDIDHVNYRRIMDNLYAFDNDNTSLSLSNVLKDKRIWLPCVFIKVNTEGYEGYEVGGTIKTKVKVFYKVFSDRPNSSKSLRDLISSDFEERIDFFNPNDPSFIQEYNGNGTLKASAHQYDEAESTFHWGSGYVETSAATSDNTKIGLYQAEVIQNLDIVIPI